MIFVKRPTICAVHNRPPRTVGFGMVWRFMPCGFVDTVLVMATLQLDAWMHTWLPFLCATPLH